MVNLLTVIIEVFLPPDAKTTIGSIKNVVLYHI